MYFLGFLLDVLVVLSYFEILANILNTYSTLSREMSQEHAIVVCFYIRSPSQMVHEVVITGPAEHRFFCKESRTLEFFNFRGVRVTIRRK